MMVKRSLRTFKIMTWVLDEPFHFVCLAYCVFFFYVSWFLIICSIVLKPRIVDWNTEDLYRVVFNQIIIFW